MLRRTAPTMDSADWTKLKVACAWASRDHVRGHQTRSRLVQRNALSKRFERRQSNGTGPRRPDRVNSSSCMNLYRRLNARRPTDRTKSWRRAHRGVIAFQTDGHIRMDRGCAISPRRRWRCHGRRRELRVGQPPSPTVLHVAARLAGMLTESFTSRRLAGGRTRRSNMASAAKAHVGVPMTNTGRQHTPVQCTRLNSADRRHPAPFDKCSEYAADTE